VLSVCPQLYCMVNRKNSSTVYNLRIYPFQFHRSKLLFCSFHFLQLESLQLRYFRDCADHRDSGLDRRQLGHLCNQFLYCIPMVLHVGELSTYQPSMGNFRHNILITLIHQPSYFRGMGACY